MELPMLIRLSTHIHRAASLKGLLVFLLLLLPFNLWLFPARSRVLEAYLGYPSTVLDARLTYTPLQVEQYLEDLGASGRRLYAASEVTLDLLYPLLYGGFLALGLALVYRALFPTHRFSRYVPLVGAAAALADLAENLSLAFLALIFPRGPDGLVFLAGTFTALKWLAGLTAGVLLLAGAGAYLAARMLGWVMRAGSR
jgi:hypothetical protein